MPVSFFTIHMDCSTFEGAATSESTCDLRNRIVNKMYMYIINFRWRSTPDIQTEFRSSQDIFKKPNLMILVYLISNYHRKTKLVCISNRNERLHDFYSKCYLEKRFALSSWLNIWGHMENLWKLTLLAVHQSINVFIF